MTGNAVTPRKVPSIRRQRGVQYMHVVSLFFGLILVMCNMAEGALTGSTQGAAAVQTTSCSTNRDCTGGSFCKLKKGGCKRKRDPKGTCTKKSSHCPRTYIPVCGCDGKTYSNACLCHSEGVNIAKNGSC
ncbi:hypothetical protein ACHAWX_006449 [Stephanocyclus meneghinianus]